MRYLLVTFLLAGLVGCGDSEVPEFEGRTLAEWVALAQSKDQQQRLQGYDGLGAFPKNETAIATLQAVIDNGARPAGEKLVAARSLYRVTDDPERVVAAARTVIRQEADKPAGLQATKDVEDLVFWLGAKARPLEPDIKYARDKVRGKDAASKRRRDDIQKILDGMPKE